MKFLSGYFKHHPELLPFSLLLTWHRLTAVRWEPCINAPAGLPKGEAQIFLL